LALLCWLNDHANAQSYTFLPPAHWARSALHRLAISGTTDITSTVLSWPASRAELFEWLDTARVGNNARAAFFRNILAAEERADRRVHAQLSASFNRHTGVIRAGTMERVNESYAYPGPETLPDQGTGTVSADLRAQLPAAFALAIRATAGTDTSQLESAYLTWRSRPVEAWAGRRGFAVGARGADNLVLNEVGSFDGLGLSARRGVRIPFVGSVHPELMLARLSHSGSVRHPWFHAARVSIVPTANFAIGLNRAAIFGGDDHIEVTAGRLLLMLIGLPDTETKDSDFENQVASIDLLWRTRIGNAPIGLYGEVGADDSGWAFVYVPGVIAGIELAELPALPELMLGLEVAHIAERTRNYPPWYQHGALADGWTNGGRLLGHSLGGAGTEIAAHGRVDAAAIPLQARGRAFLRERKGENLLAPLRQGRSAGGRLEILLPWRRTQLQLRGELESGGDWQASSLAVMGSVFW
jgi:hypothetical protein